MRIARHSATPWSRPGRGIDDPGGFHVPRSVRRSRPHLRQDERHARPEHLARGSPAGTLAESRSRLPLRCRAHGARVGEVLRGRRSSPQDGQDGCRRWALCDGRVRSSPRRGDDRRRRSARRSSRTHGTTRTSPSPRRTSPSSASTTVSSTRCLRPCRPARPSPGPAGSSPGTTSGCSAPTSCPGSAQRVS